MIRNRRDEDPPTGEGRSGGAMAAPTPWMGLRDPRIVRVSRSLGGKDRHSKVNTVRGLRDRRVRLSVPTALQLYDLQDKLGLSQPSKAVDWLLSAAQHEIDKLPPLQFPPGSFVQHPPSVAAAHAADLHQPISGPAMAEEMELMGDQTGVKKSTPWSSSSEHAPRARIWKEHTKGALMDEKDGLLHSRSVEQEHHGEDGHSTGAPAHPSMPSSASNNNNMYASYYYNLDGSNVCVAHVGGYVMSPAEEIHGRRPQQLLWCPSGMLPPAAPSADYDPKHVNSFFMGFPAS